MDKEEWIIMMEKMQEIRQFCSSYSKRAVKGGITSAMELDLLSRVEFAKLPLTPQLLCGDMGISKTQLSRQVEQLVKKGFLDKRTSTKDRRSYFLQITPSGSEEVKATYTGYLKPIYQLRRTLGDADFETLLKLICKANREMEA